jgi:hypothetical protein
MLQPNISPFIELIELKKQEAALILAIKNKQQEALDWHFSSEETKKLTGKVAEIDGASVAIKFVKKKPAPTPEIKAMLDRASEIEGALKIANKIQISDLESQISELSRNKESATLTSQANQLLSSIDGEIITQIAITLPKEAA